MLEATPTADPVLEPPGVRCLFQGFNVEGGSPQANSVVTVFPIIIDPADLRRATEVASKLGI